MINWLLHNTDIQTKLSSPYFRYELSDKTKVAKNQKPEAWIVLLEITFSFKKKLPEINYRYGKFRILKKRYHLQSIVQYDYVY